MLWPVSYDDDLPDVCSVAAADHVPEGVLVSAASDQSVADGLVTFPPGTGGTVDHGVLARGRDLAEWVKNTHRSLSVRVHVF